MGELRNILLALVVFSIMIMGMTTFLVDIATNYGLEADVSELRSFVMIDNTTTIVAGVKANTSEVVSGYDQNKWGTDVFGFVFFGTVKAVEFMFNAVSLPVVLLNKAVVMIGIPQEISAWVVGGITAMILITIIFAVLSAIMKWNL